MLSFKMDQKISAEGYKKRNKTLEFLSTSSMLGLLSACGGGGGGTAPDNEASSKEDLTTRPSLTPLAHDINGTTHITGLSSLVTDPYEGYPTFINGEFDFTNLELTNEFYTYAEFAGPTIIEQDGSEYGGMVDYSRSGDVDGDGLSELIIGGWTVDTDNAPGRLFIIHTDEVGEITQIEWTSNDGTAAPWVDDFDNDGIDEIFSVGFYDFPVKPAQSFYYPNGLGSKEEIGVPLDSHESALVDYDNDGDNDIVAITYGQATGYISLFENNDGTFEHKYLTEILDGERITGSSIEVADLNGDGDYELIIGDYMWIYNDPVIISWDNTTSNWTTEEFSLPNLYLTSDKFDGINSIFTNNNPDASTDQIAGARSHEVDIKAVDVDLDGDLDLLISSALWHNDTPMGVIQIMHNNGDGTFTDVTETSLFNYQLTANAAPHDLHFADVNQDGFFDILVAEPSSFNPLYSSLGVQSDLAMLSEGNTILLNDGTGSFIQTAFAFFSKPGSAWDQGLNYANKWHGIINPDGKLGFVSLSETWDSHPLGGEIVYASYVTFEETLSTGPKFVNAAEYGAPGFNEFYVLRNNPDVQEMVKDGTYGSALEWYLETQPSNIKTFAANAKVIGSETEDTIILREGDETAVGYEGNDTITGGSGADTFVFTKDENGTDTITDFSFADGDRIDLSSFGISSEETAKALISDETIIQLTEENSIVRYEDIEAAAISIDGDVVAYFHGVSAVDFTAADGWLA